MEKCFCFLSLIVMISLGACTENSDSVPNSPYYEEGLEEGVNYGIAWQYSNDEGIADNEFVLGAEGFESGAVEIYTEEDRYKNNVDVVTHNIYSGQYAGKHTWTEGENGPTCRFPIPQEAHEVPRPAYFVRMYLNFASSFHPGEGMEPVGVKGFGIYNESGPHGPNTPCDGTNWYGVSCQFVGWGPSVKEAANDKYLWFGHMYSYNAYPTSAIANLGEIKITDPRTGDQPYRFSIYSKPYKYIKFDQWYCYELGLFLNSVGKHDGEARFWINGVLQSRATNMRFRDLEGLKPESVHLNLHRTTDDFPHTMVRYADNIVIATRYIGPMK